MSSAHGAYGTADSVGWTCTAFGVGFRADFAMPGLPTAPVEDAPRRTELRLAEASAEEPDAEPDGRRLFHERFGEAVVTLTRSADGAFRSASSVHGDFRLTGDGRQIRCFVDGRPPWLWRRFLVGQVLPLAALLSGLETLHASAVADDGGVIVVAGPSHAGKSSIAAHLVAAGAALLADDVVALERVRDEVVAHPALGLLGLRRSECARVGARRLSELGPCVVANEKELLLAVPRPDRPLPVRSVYLPEHTARRGDRVRFVRCDDPRFLLGATYNNVLQAPERLTDMLDVYALVSRTARVFRILVPSDVGAAQLAEAIAEHDRDSRC